MWGTKLLAVVAVASSITLNAIIGGTENKQGTISTAASTTNKMDSYIYPGAQLVSSDGDSYLLVAETTLDEATNWYSNTLEKDKMKDKNIIRSDTNGEKVNLLMGSGLAGEMDIAIKEETRGLVTIAISHNFGNALQI